MTREQCEDCGKLLVEPGGPKNAEVLLLAEFPGYYEIKEGKPWVGPAGDIIKNELRRMVKTEPFVINDQHILYRKSLFSFGRYADELNITIYPAPFDICDYEYYVLDKVSAYQPAIAQVNVHFANIFTNNNLTLEYQNNHLVILKNHNPGVECLAT